MHSTSGMSHSKSLFEVNQCGTIFDPVANYSEQATDSNEVRDLAQIRAEEIRKVSYHINMKRV